MSSRKPVKKIIPSRQQPKAITLAYMPGGVEGAVHAAFIVGMACLLIALIPWL